MTREQMVLQWRHRPHRVWLPGLLPLLLIACVWLALLYPAVAVALAATAVALVLIADFALAIVFVIAFETFFPLVQYKSAALTNFPTGIALLALLLLSATIARLRLPGRAAFRWTALDWAVAAFAALCLISVAAGSDLTVALGGVRDELKYFVVYAAVRWAGPALSRAQADLIGRSIVWLLFVVAAVGVAQYMVGYTLLADFAQVQPSFALQYMGLGQFSPDGGIHMVVQHRRVYSVLLSPLYTGYAAMGGALFAPALYLARRMSGISAAFWCAICVTCTLLTYTRTAMAGLAVGAGVLVAVILCSDRLALAARVRVLAALLAGAFGVGAVLGAAEPALLQYPLSVMSGDSTATNGHYQFLQDDLGYLMAHPLGAGIGRASLVFLHTAPQQLAVWTESWYFYIAAELGIPGLALFLLICGLVLRMLLSTLRSERGGDGIVLGTTLWFCALLVAGIAGVPFFSWMLAAALWTLIGLLVNEEMRDVHHGDTEARRLHGEA